MILIDEHLADSDSMDYEIDRPSGLTIGYAGTNYDTFLQNLSNQKVSFQKFDDTFVAKYKEEGTSFEEVMDDVSAQFGLVTEAAAGFTLLLLLFAGPGGLRALLSFVITVLCLWKIMIPYCLKGGNAILCGLAVITLLTAVIILFVYGFDRRSLVAVSGSMLGMTTACLVGIFFTSSLNIHGAVMSASEALLYSGYESLNLTQLFMASIFIGASGAMMDLAMDITNGICEVVRKKPGIGRWELVGGGLVLSGAKGNGSRQGF